MVRSFVFVWYEQAHFDSDQAIVGLMALHLSQLKTFPVYFYGQTYMLAIEAWIAAPWVLLAGASVTALKLPLLAINVACGATLVWLLVREAKLRPLVALVVSLFFTAAPPIAASRLVEAQGGNIEPFAYVLVLWILRGHSLWAGAVLGIGFLHREFTLYGAMALVILGLLDRSLFSRAGARRFLKMSAAAGAVFFIVSGLALLAGYAGTKRPALSGVDPLQVAHRLQEVVTIHVPVLLGSRVESLQRFNIASELAVGHLWLALPLGFALALILVRVTQRGRACQSLALGPSAFPLYLALVGLQSAAGYLVVPAGGDATYIRYTLLVLLFPLGLVALHAQSGSSSLERSIVLGCVLVWGSASWWDHARLIDEYRVRRPPNRHQELIYYLAANDIRFAKGDYWTAYHLTFLAEEKLIVSSTDLVRIPEYQRLVEAHSDSAALVGVGDAPCASPVRLRRWYVCRP